MQALLASHREAARAELDRVVLESTARHTRRTARLRARNPAAAAATYDEAERAMSEIRKETYWQWREVRSCFAEERKTAKRLERMGGASAPEGKYSIPIDSFIRIVVSMCKCGEEDARAVAKKFSSGAGGVDYKSFIEDVLKFFSQ
jgi:predicted transcriptional regulator